MELSEKLKTGYELAEKFKCMVFKRTKLKGIDLVCPREKSMFSPCIARDGELAVAESIHGPACVGCNAVVKDLFDKESKKH